MPRLVEASNAPPKLSKSCYIFCLPRKLHTTTTKPIRFPTVSQGCKPPPDATLEKHPSQQNAVITGGLELVCQVTWQLEAGAGHLECFEIVEYLSVLCSQ